jgi:hypothetical protein
MLILSASHLVRLVLTSEMLHSTEFELDREVLRMARHWYARELGLVLGCMSDGKVVLALSPWLQPAHERSWRVSLLHKVWPY